MKKIILTLAITVSLFGFDRCALELQSFQKEGLNLSNKLEYKSSKFLICLKAEEVKNHAISVITYCSKDQAARAKKYLDLHAPNFDKECKKQ